MNDRGASARIPGTTQAGRGDGPFKLARLNPLLSDPGYTPANEHSAPDHPRSATVHLPAGTVEADGSLPTSRLKSDRKFITPLARGLAILAAFRPSDGWVGNKDIASRVELPVATTNRLLKSLTLLGYLERSDQHRKYRLAPAVLSLGYAAVAHNDVKQLVRPRLRKFAEQQKLVVMLGYRDKFDVVLLDVAHSSSSVLSLRLEPGARLPLAESALGWALVAGLPKPEQDYLLGRIANRYGDAAQTVTQRMRQALEHVERTGYCVSPGLRGPEITAVAAPLVAPDGSRVLTIACAGVTTSLGGERIHRQLGPELAALAEGLGRDLPPRDF